MDKIKSILKSLHLQFFGKKTTAVIVGIATRDDWSHSKVNRFRASGTHKREITLEYYVQEKMYRCRKDVSRDMRTIDLSKMGSEVQILYSKKDPQSIFIYY